MPAPHPFDPPDDAERPVPLTAADDATSEAGSWDVGGTTPDGPARPRPEDEIREEQAHATRDDRRDRADGGGETPSDDVDDESAYPTETEQGAAQPGPASA